LQRSRDLLAKSDQRNAIELEGHCYNRLRLSEDFKEGVEAFNAKRPPKFIGR